MIIITLRLMVIINIICKKRNEKWRRTKTKKKRQIKEKLTIWIKNENVVAM